jgi:hypothetical protein
MTQRTLKNFHCITLIFLCFSYFHSKSQDAPLYVWAGNFKATGGSPPESFGFGIDTDPSGNVYSTGAFGGTVDFDPGSGTFNLTSTSTAERDIYVSRLNADGTFAWAVAIGFPGKDDSGWGITTDASGNVYVTGQFFGTIDFDPGPGVTTLPGNVTNASMFILKLDTNGNFVWAGSIGNGGFVAGRGITLDNSGNVITTGTYNAVATDFDPGAGTFTMSSGGAFVCKLDGSGNFIWAQSTSSSAGGFSVATDNADNILIAGQFSGTVDFNPGAGTFNLTAVAATDIVVFKLDTNGNFVWAGSMGSNLPDAGTSVAVDNSGNVFVTGNFNGTSDFDPGAGTFNITSAGLYDAFITKLDASGNLVWVYSIGGSTAQDDNGNAVAIDASGNVVFTGFFDGTVDFDPGPGVFNLTSAATSSGALHGDVYILKLDNNGNFIWAFREGTSNYEDEGNAISIDASDNIYATGSFTSSADFDPGPCTNNLVTAFLTDKNAFVQKITLGPTYIPVISLVSPSSGPVGTTVTITGTGFSPTLTDNIVKFGAAVATVSANTTTDITVTAPAGTGTKNVTVTIGCSTSPLGFSFTYTAGTVPTITSFTPTSGPIGTTVTITGTNFSTTPANNTVAFNGTTATVTASSATNITTTVPAGATSGKITVTVSGNTATSVTDFTVTGALPTISSFTPASGLVGTTVTITGTNFSITPSNNTVAFNGTNATVTASSATSITTTVPAGATSGKITVTVSGNTATSATDFTVTVLPTITGFTPTNGPVSTSVTITGTNFSATPANNTVKFNGTTATVISSTATSISTTVPSGATTGKISVTVSGNTATSAADFTVTVPGIVINPEPQSTSSCEGETAAFTLAASGAANLTYQWQKFDGSVFNDIADGGGYSGTTNETLSVNTSGNFGAADYRCKVSGTAVPDGFSQVVSLTVNQFPAAIITSDGTQLTASAGDSYQWYQNNEVVQNATGQTFTYDILEYGTYMVDITVNGCTSTSDVFTYLITEKENDQAGWKIYPSPFKSSLTIEHPPAQNIHGEIVDAIGRTIKKISIDSREIFFMDPLPAGQYYIVIKTTSQTLRFRIVRMQEN